MAIKIHMPLLEPCARIIIHAPYDTLESSEPRFLRRFLLSAILSQ